MKINEVITFLEHHCPPEYQESYDNCGLLTGDRSKEITSILLSVDCTEKTIEEAIARKCNLIISHHPILFFPLKKLSGNSYPERAIIKAIKNDVAIYAMHTNLDNITRGVNLKIAQKLGLENPVILSPKKRMYRKLVTYCPIDKAEKVRNALFKAGAGEIGEYSECSFNTTGTGTFRAGENTTPYVGEKGKTHYEKEERIETVFPLYIEKMIIKALLASHPYQEVAYDLYSLENENKNIGSGMVGELKKPLNETSFIGFVKKTMQAGCVRYSPLLGKTIKRVAVCGGAGSFLITDAIKSGADAFVTADFKYHEFFNADGKILICDIGHYESEQFTPEIIHDLLKQKFRTFAILFSKTNTNPVNYK
jgi:dinuclear metal center YbgI/SA1388 family protein